MQRNAEKVSTFYVMIKHNLDERELDQVGRVAAATVELERPTVPATAADKRPSASNRVGVDWRGLTRDAKMPKHDVGVRSIDRRPRLKPTVQTGR